jgi:hypothetical protein
MNKPWKAAALAAPIIALLCAAPALAGDPAAGSHRSPAPAGATVRFVGLADGDVVAPTFTVAFEIEGMDIAPAGTDVPNTGHHHLLVDVAEPPDPQLPLPKNEQFIHFGGGQTQTQLTLPEGEHTLQLIFADYVHIPHDPVVKSERITITVSADAAAGKSAEQP